MQFKTPRNDLQDTLNLLHTVLANWNTLSAVPNNLNQGVYSYDFDGYHVVLRRGLCSLLGLVHTDDRYAMFECWRTSRKASPFRNPSHRYSRQSASRLKIQ